MGLGSLDWTGSRLTQNCMGHSPSLLEGDPSQCDSASFIIIKRCLGEGSACAEAHAGGAWEVWGGLQLSKSEQQPNLEMPGPHTD